jgi:hypothetical protein
MIRLARLVVVGCRSRQMTGGVVVASLDGLVQQALADAADRARVAWHYAFLLKTNGTGSAASAV